MKLKVILFVLSILVAAGLVAASPDFQQATRFRSIFVDHDVTIGDSLDMTNGAITNVGAAGTDFGSNGSLTTAQGVTISAGGLTVSAGGATIAGTVALDASEIGATEIADISRAVPLPLRSFIECTTDAGADINFTSGADAFPDFINSATDGLGFTLSFDATGGSVDTTRVCASITVPQDYVSGGAVVVRATKGAETGTNSELITCAGSINGAALGATGTITATGTASAAYTCTPTLTSLAAGNSVALTLYITSGGTPDDQVDIASAEFRYAASQ